MHPSNTPTSISVVSTQSSSPNAIKFSVIHVRRKWQKRASIWAKFILSNGHTSASEHRPERSFAPPQKYCNMALRLFFWERRQSKLDQRRSSRKHVEFCHAGRGTAPLNSDRRLCAWLCYSSKHFTPSSSAGTPPNILNRRLKVRPSKECRQLLLR
jgi:hypothetical protein